MSEPRFGAAVVQAAPVAFDVEATLAKAECLTAEAAAAGARLVVFPEAFVSCYPRGITFGATVGSRTEEGARGSGATGSPPSTSRAPSSTGSGRSRTSTTCTS
jgi:hypothetical protein